MKIKYFSPNCESSPLSDLPVGAIFIGVDPMKKKCTKCGVEKDLSEFHNDKSKKDRKCSKCKPCAIIRARQQELDDPIRAAKYKSEYSKRPYRILASRIRSANNRRANPIQVKARQMVNNAVRDGRVLRPSKCSKCNEKKRLEMHHNDYSKPLEVIFLCIKCHKEWHMNNTPLNKG